MNSNIRKMFGYVLLCVGLICVMVAFYGVFKAFTGAAKPPEIFKMQELTFLASAGTGNPPTEITVLVNPDIRKIVDMFLYYLLMLFILGVGSKLSTLGAQFIREIKVEVKKQD